MRKIVFCTLLVGALLLLPSCETQETDTKKSDTGMSSFSEEVDEVKDEAIIPPTYQRKPMTDIPTAFLFVRDVSKINTSMNRRRMLWMMPSIVATRLWRSASVLR